MLPITSNNERLDHTPTAEEPLRGLVEAMGLKPNQIFGILRNALTAQLVSSPVFEMMEIIGREKVLERVRKAIALLEATL